MSEHLGVDEIVTDGAVEVSRQVQRQVPLSGPVAAQPTHRPHFLDPFEGEELFEVDPQPDFEYRLASLQDDWESKPFGSGVPQGHVFDPNSYLSITSDYREEVSFACRPNCPVVEEDESGEPYDFDWDSIVVRYDSDSEDEQTSEVEGPELFSMAESDEVASEPSEVLFDFHDCFECDFENEGTPHSEHIPIVLCDTRWAWIKRFVVHLVFAVGKSFTSRAIVFPVLAFLLVWLLLTQSVKAPLLATSVVVPTQHRSTFFVSNMSDYVRCDKDMGPPSMFHLGRGRIYCCGYHDIMQHSFLRGLPHGSRVFTLMGGQGEEQKEIDRNVAAACKAAGLPPPYIFNIAFLQEPRRNNGWVGHEDLYDAFIREVQDTLNAGHDVAIHCMSGCHRGATGWCMSCLLYTSDAADE